MNERDFMVGYYGEPCSLFSRMHVTKCHAISADTRLPLCGYRPSKKMLFQWCSWTYNDGYLDCASCKKIARKMLKVKP